MNPTASEQCAAALVEVAPLLTMWVRAQMRASGHGLEMLQYQSLAFLDHHPGASLSAVAEHLGLSLASASRKVDGLVERGLIVREAGSGDRRRISLRLSERGQELVEAVWQYAREGFSARLAGLGPDDLTALLGALGTIKALFGRKPASDRRLVDPQSTSPSASSPKS